VPIPRDIRAIDTLIGFRDTHQMGVASTKGDWKRHPAEYMFKDIPEEISADDDRLSVIAETVAQMDAHNIGIGVIHMSDDRAEEAMKRYPDRFIAIRPVDPNKGMDAVRMIAREHAASSPIRSMPNVWSWTCRFSSTSASPARASQ
jgi:uncharacterized protein